MSSVKVEFIYYRETGDPRLEFGLNGNFTTRVLSTSCEEDKEYLYALKKAVSRNTVIIVVGGFRNDGHLAKLTALAIGRKCEEYDFVGTGYGNIVGAPDLLPEKCLPLVDTNSTFAGILLESGPQSIIMLSENNPNKAFIIKEYISPYVEEKHK